MTFNTINGCTNIRSGVENKIYIFCIIIVARLSAKTHRLAVLDHVIH